MTENKEGKEIMEGTLEKKMNNEQFVRAWVKAYLKGESVAQLARKLNLKYSDVYRRGARLADRFVDMPLLSGQRARKTRESEKLNEIIRSMITPGNETRK